MALKEKILDRAQKYIQKGSFDKAIAEYRSAADLDPKDISIRLRIGDLYVKTGNRAEAVKEYTEVAKANTKKGFYLKSIAVYKQVLKLEESLEIHHRLAELYVKQRLIADAISEYNYIMSFYEKRGKSAEVIDLLKKMAEIDPENVGVRLKLADIYMRLSFDKDAFSEYSWVLDRLVSQDKFDKAEKIYQTLLSSKPGEAWVLKGLAELCEKKGEASHAVRYLKPLLKAYIDAEDDDAAKTVCESILRIDPRDKVSLDFLESIGQQESPAEWTPSGEKPLLDFPELPKAAPEKEEKTEKPVREEGPEETPALAVDEIEITLEGFGEEPVEAAEKAAQAEVHEEVEIEIEEAPEAPTPEIRAAEEAVKEDVQESAAQAPPPQSEERPFEIEIEAEAPEQAPLIEVMPSVAPEDEIREAMERLEARQNEEEDAAREEPSAPEQAFRAEEAGDSIKDEPVINEGTAEVEIAAKEEIQEEAKEEPLIPALEELKAEVEEQKAEEVALKATSIPDIEEKDVEESLERLVSEAAGAMAEEGKADPREEEPLIEEPFDAPQPLVEEPPQIEEAVGGIAKEEAVIEDAQEAAVPEAAEVRAGEQEEISSAISELMEKFEPDDELLGTDKIEEPAAPAETEEEEYVDLSAELGMKEALDDKAGSSWAGADSRDAFDEFKSGIVKQLSKEDSETHYNLAIAYMEMEMFNEASKEFKIALKDPRLEFECYIRLGLCAMAVSNPEEAIVYYLKGLKVEDRSEDERKGIMYELALAYEAAGERDEAAQLFKSIYEIDPEFRDIAKKARAAAPAVPAATRIPLDDGLIEVELL